MSTNAEIKEGRIPGRLAYAGVRRTQGGGISHAYYKVDSEGKVSDTPCLYKSKLTKSGSIGSILDVEFSADGVTVYFTKSMIPSEYLTWDRVTALGWRAESEAIETAEKAKKKQREAANENPLKDQLDPIRQAYMEASYSDKPALLANIITYITR